MNKKGEEGKERRGTKENEKLKKGEGKRKRRKRKEKI